MSNNFNITINCDSNTAAELMALAVEMGGEVTSFKKQVAKIVPQEKVTQAETAITALMKPKGIKSPKRRTCFDVYKAICDNFLSSQFTINDVLKAMKITDSTVTQGSVSAHTFRLVQAGFLFKGMNSTYFVNKQTYTSDRQKFESAISEARANA